MRIMVAPNSFKGSLSGEKICNIVEEAAKKVFECCEVDKVPAADGGEGTVESIIAALDRKNIEAKVQNAIGEEIVATYGHVQMPVQQDIFEVMDVLREMYPEKDFLNQTINLV